MVIRLKWANILLALLVVLLLVSGLAAVFSHTGALDTTMKAVLVSQESSASEKLLIYLFSDSIQAQSDLFYGPYYSVMPTIAHFSTKVKQIEEAGTNVYITFSVLPYIGPHDTIGEDEITFRVSSAGEITAEEFKHLKNYVLPDNLSYLLKGALPPLSK